MVQVAIGLGSNLGDRPANLRAAFHALERGFGKVIASPIYETAPMYVADQPPFLNAAALVWVDDGPMGVLKALKAIEREVGRIPRERNGPREIDLDLLCFGPAIYRFVDKGRDVLRIPHPRIPERRFVLQPLSDMAPTMRLPGLGVVSQLLHATDGEAASVRRFDDAVLSIPS